MTAHRTLVMLHGLLGCGAELQSQALPDGWQAWAPDLPGHGSNHNYHLPREKGFPAFEQWLSQQLQQAGITRYWLYGYSLGGRLALYYASRWPAGMQGLILESCHPGLLEENQRQARLRNDHEWAEHFRQRPLSEVLEAWYRQPVFADLDGHQRQQLMALRMQNSGPDVAAMLEATSLGRQRNLWPWLQEPPCPVHYLIPDRDTKFKQLGRQLATICPNIEHHYFVDAGHNIRRAVPAAWLTTLNHILNG